MNAPLVSSQGPHVPQITRKQGWTVDDAYFAFWVFTLTGYALFGKGFAYIGIPPLYIGEILLLTGVVIVLRNGCFLAALASVPSLFLLALMALVLMHVFSDLQKYGIEAIRDSVIVMYGIIALTTAGILIADPNRLELIIGYYRKFSTILVVMCPFMIIFSSFMYGSLPNWPNSGLPLIFVRTGELAVHLTGVAVFALMGFRSRGIAWTLLLLAGATIVFAQNRGGAVSFAIPTMIALLFATDRKQLLMPIMVAALVGTLAVVGDFRIEAGGGRNIDAQQLVANVASIFDDSNTGNLSGTKEWRMSWWASIIQYTFHGDYFWSGKGFGMSLAEADGFVVGQELGGPILRSPHNAHMTILARMGVPGLTLWALLLLSWFAMLALSAIAAWRAGEVRWARFFLFIACYALSAIIDASFDVALEGPMIGIWFWALIGVGLGASAIYRARRPGLSGLRLAARLSPL